MFRPFLFRIALGIFRSLGHFSGSVGLLQLYISCLCVLKEATLLAARLRCKGVLILGQTVTPLDMSYCSVPTSLSPNQVHCSLNCCICSICVLHELRA